MKPNECLGCALYDCPGPVPGEFTDEEVDVVFVGEALGAVEVQQHRPMVGQAGRVLRHTIKYYIEDRKLPLRYGITNVWVCRPPGNKLPEDAEEPAEYCRRRLYEDLTTHGQKLTVPLGSTALDTITNVGMSITSIQGHMFSTDYNGTRLVVLPMFHPSYLRRHGSSWRYWELGWDKLEMYIRDGKTHFIPFSQRKVHHAHSPAEALQFLKRIRELSREYPVMSCDVETSAGYHPWAGARLLSVSIAWKSTECVAIMWHDIEHFPAYDELKALLEDPNIIWLWYQGLFDTAHFRNVGMEPRIDRDGLLEMHLIDERPNIHGLKSNSWLFLDAPNWEADIKEYAPKKEDSYEKIPPEKLLEYNGMDTVHTIHLSEVAHDYFELEGLTWYYDNILAPAYDMLARSRFIGLRCDLYRVKSLQGEIQPVLNDLHKQMCEVAGDPFFNPRSPAQVKELLHSRGIMVPNTRKEVLEEYLGDELVDAIRDYRDADKMMSTYIIGVVDDVYDDLRVHPDWKYPTETGRLRCGDPNLLGMPRKAEIAEHKWKRFIKEIWVADPDTLFMHIDRGQSEVRCNVYLAKAKDFMQRLIDDPTIDIHGEYATMLFGPDFTYEQRFLAKMIVTFAVPYGAEAESVARRFTAAARQTARNIAEKAGLDRRALKGSANRVGLQNGIVYYHAWTVLEARKIISDFFAKMPEVDEARKRWKHTALTEGKLVNYFGRIRRFGLVAQERRKHVGNEAYNFPPSSLSNDLNLLSCIETRRQFGKYGVEVLVPIHDAGLLRLPKQGAEQLAADIQGVWEALPTQYLHTDLPFPCEVTLGERWSDL